MYTFARKCPEIHAKGLKCHTRHAIGEGYERRTVLKPIPKHVAVLLVRLPVLRHPSHVFFEARTAGRGEACRARPLHRIERHTSAPHIRAITPQAIFTSSTSLCPRHRRTDLWR